MDTLTSAFKEQAARDAENLRRASEEAGMQIDSQPELPNLHTLQASFFLSALIQHQSLSHPVLCLPSCHSVEALELIQMLLSAFIEGNTLPVPYHDDAPLSSQVHL